ncbi:MAG: DUF4920 domain-containing protein [Bacteroidia bacterium]|nr:DUF4920 domain-containing protein [Bacteroidia bacterium]
MKFRFILLMSLSLLWACQAETQKEESQEKTSATSMNMSYHGEKIDAENAVSVAQLPELMGDEKMKEGIKLEGDLSAVCKNKGCWMKTVMDGDQSLHITFKDYGFFVPTDAAGKKAIFEGKAYYDTTDVATLRHYAVDGGMSEEEAEKTITEPKYSLAFEATGVIIQDEGK